MARNCIEDGLREGQRGSCHPAPRPLDSRGRAGQLRQVLFCRNWCFKYSPAHLGATYAS